MRPPALMREKAPLVVLSLVLLMLPVLLAGLPYWQRVIPVLCVYALLALSYDFLANFVGLISLGGAFFVGVGAYLAAILNTEFGLPPVASIPLATVLGALFCTICMLPTLPLRGVYFAIVSLMYPLLASRIIEALELFGGTEGIIGLESLPGPLIEQYGMLLILAAAVWALSIFLKTPTGIILQGIRDNQKAVQACGIGPALYKAWALFLGAGLGTLGGAFLAHYYMWAGMSQFALDFSLMPIAATVVGGGASLAGPVLGCLILVPLMELLRDFGSLRIVIYALVLAALVLVKSQGLYHLLPKARGDAS